ncbi:protein FAM107B [Scleropages formosus]|uniref:protein FAM107B n=1 Tax=Scleropages formosus TaxID=113540 RepID=UPI0008781D01|nr:protein FAM107B-like [Scleropages formosus]XP_029102013.1 protein FAM107B-like [Scleropages formosus]
MINMVTPVPGRFSFSRSPSTLERQPRKPPRSTMEGGPALTPRKPSGSAMEPPSHQDLHRELLLSHKRGLLPGEKPELQRVLEQRRLDQHREQEQALRPPSDLEQELRKRQQKMEEYEKEERKRREEQENVPEFVRVKENLRHVPVSQ